MTWKDDYREQYEDSGKTWDEFVQSELYHEDELDDLRACVDSLQKDVSILSEHIQDLRRNIGEVLILVEGHDEE